MAYPSKKVHSLLLSDNGMVFDPETGSIYTTNQTGLSILNALKETTDITFIKERLVKEYVVDDPEKIERDILDFLNQLESLGLIKEI